MPTPQRIEIKVTQEHIDRGRNRPPTARASANCAVALALQEQANPIAVCGEYSAILGKSALVSFFPKEATAWIMAFDRGFPVKPFTFELEVTA